MTLRTLEVWVLDATEKWHDAIDDLLDLSLEARASGGARILYEAQQFARLYGLDVRDDEYATDMREEIKAVRLRVLQECLMIDRRAIEHAERRIA